MDRSMRLTDILLEPVSNLMGLVKAEGSKLDAAARRLEAQALLLNTRRLPATRCGAGRPHGSLIETLRGSVGFRGPGSHGPNRRAIRPTEAFSELAVPA